MATTFKWASAESSTTYLTPGPINDGSFAGVGSAITNSTDLYQYINLEVTLGSLSPAAGAYVDIWCIVSLDGTTFANTSKPLQTSALLATFQCDTAASTTQRMVIRNVTIPPLDFKLDLRNKTGVQFAPSGNALNYRRHNEQAV